MVSRQIYKWQKTAVPDGFTDIQRAARFYYLQKLSFGGKVSGRTFGTATTSPPRLNLLRIEEDLSAAHLRLSKTVIEHLAWADCVTKYDREKTLFYFDPPYWQTEGYGVEFGFEQYQKLAEMMRSMNGKAVLSINKHPDIEEVFREFQTKEVPITYTVGGAGKRPDRIELIITNFKAAT